MRIKTASIGMAYLCMCMALVGCNSQGNQGSAAAEDQGQYPDTTATDGNMILPSDDAIEASDSALDAGSTGSSAIGQ